MWLEGHALIDVTSGRDVLSYFHCWLWNDLTCMSYMFLNDRFDLYPLRIMQMFNRLNKEHDSYFGTWCE